MEDVTFIFHKEWLDAIKGLPVEQQDKVISDLVRYGVEEDLAHNDPVTQSLVNMLRGRIDYSKDKYEEKKHGGRKKKMDEKAIWDLARAGKKSQEIADLLGLSKSAVDHSEGWRQRKNDNASFFDFGEDNGEDFDF